MLRQGFAQRAQVAGDENLADYLAHCARSAGGAVERTPDHVFFTGGPHPGPFSNGIIRRGAGGHPDELLDKAEEFFGRLRRGYLCWVRDHLDADLVERLHARGYVVREPAEGLCGVAVDRRPAEYAVPAGCTLRRIDDEDGLVDYLEIIAEVYQLADAPRSVQESVLFSLASARDPAMSVFLLYEGDRALSASANFVSGGCGGMQWTGTRREAKGRGLGQVVCAAAWASAFDRGEELVVGQSSVIGTPVWLDMGFEQVTRYRRFMSPPARNTRT